jgi:phage regulator Rha-like protein
MSNEQYVVVTTISQFKIRYVVPMSELQKENPDTPVDPQWALDGVTCNDYEEFSQDWLGEVITDWQVENEEQIIERFDKENDYLAGWTTEQKLNNIRRNGTSHERRNAEEISTDD